MKAYYNEFEPYPAQWLRNLIFAGEIAPGVVDERSILDVTPEDLTGYDRCHFFAGIAGWDYALRLAGWPEDQPVWTGSCPCQPFSSAGRGGGGADERHLWPAWFWLIRQCRPPVVFGEQVASKAGLAWLEVVFSDLEAAGYSCGAADLCAASLGAPHIRQRLWFVAMANPGSSRSGNFDRTVADQRGRTIQPGGESIRQDNGATLPDRIDPTSPTGILGHASQRQCEGDGLQQIQREWHPTGQESDASRPSPTGELADLESVRRKRTLYDKELLFSTQGKGAINNPWLTLHWLPCRDGKWRPTGVVADSERAELWKNSDISRQSHQGRTPERFRYDGTDAQRTGPPKSGLFQMADEFPAELGLVRAEEQTIISPLIKKTYSRVGRLKGYGNAIVPAVAAEFIRAVIETLSP